MFDRDLSLILNLAVSANSSNRINPMSWFDVKNHMLRNDSAETIQVNDFLRYINPAQKDEYYRDYKTHMYSLCDIGCRRMFFEWSISGTLYHKEELDKLQDWLVERYNSMLTLDQKIQTCNIWFAMALKMNKSDFNTWYLAVVSEYTKLITNIYKFYGVPIVSTLMENKDEVIEAVQNISCSRATEFREFYDLMDSLNSIALGKLEYVTSLSNDDLKCFLKKV